MAMVQVGLGKLQQPPRLSVCDAQCMQASSFPPENAHVLAFRPKTHCSIGRRLGGGRGSGPALRPLQLDPRAAGGLQGKRMFPSRLLFMHMFCSMGCCLGGMWCGMMPWLHSRFSSGA